MGLRDWFRRKQAAPPPPMSPPSSQNAARALRRERLFTAIAGSFAPDNNPLRRNIPFTSARHSAEYIRAIAARSDVLTSVIKLIRRQAIGNDEVQPRWADIKNKHWRKRVQALWAQWAISVTADGQQSMRELQASICETIPVDGLVLCDVRFAADHNQGIAVLPISRQWLAEGYSSDDKKVNCGIEYSAAGKIIAYWVYKNALDGYAQARDSFGSGLGGYGGYGAAMILGGEMVRIPASTAMRLSIGGRIDDHLRAPSPLLATVNALRQIAQTDDATIDAMKAAAAQMVFFTKGEGAEIGDAGNASPEMLERERELYRGFADGMDGGGYVEGGGAAELPTGYKVESFTPSSPRTAATDFRVAKLMTACAALGIDYATATGDLSKVNFSSLRHANLQTRAVYREYQTCIAERLMRPLVKKWLSHHRHITGELSKCPEGTYRALQDVDFRFRRWEWIQPKEEIERWVKAIAAGIASPQQAVAAAGYRWADLVNDWREAGDAAKEVEENTGLPVSHWLKQFAGGGGGGGGDGGDGGDGDKNDGGDGAPDDDNKKGDDNDDKND